jgi:ketosteroid isomerase-like protein
MSDHPHAARYREMSAAMNAGDMSGLGEAIADDVVWWEIGASEPARGKQALLDRMQALGEYNVSAQLHDVVANEDHLIALLSVEATKGDATLHYRTAEIHHVNANGQVTERWAFSDDTQAIVDFFQ